MKVFIRAALAALAMVATPAVAQVVYDTTPTAPLTYGDGNDYSPANAAVLTGGGSELVLRAHVPGQPAQSTEGTGIYTFDLGSAVSFDFSLSGTQGVGTSIFLTNLLTGDNASFNPTTFGLGTLEGTDTFQGSQQLGFGFLNGGFGGFFGDLNFDANQNNTYSIALTGGGNPPLTIYAQLGTGYGVTRAVTGAVPEPSTWAMMLVGFGAIGGALRRRKPSSLIQMA